MNRGSGCHLRFSVAFLLSRSIQNDNWKLDIWTPDRKRRDHLLAQGA